ncbi:MAG TPA: asparagine synthase-related protein [Candidatus Udaeobacter sp.]
MNGITGIFGLGTDGENESLLSRMLEPTLQGDTSSLCTYANRELGILFVCGPVDAGQLPNFAWNKARTIGCLISGDAFIASSDAQADLIDLYEELGLSALERLNGWFSGVLVDLQHRQAILFNDRYALRRIYIHEENCRVLFSTEAKSLLAAIPKARELDPRSLGEWLSCGCALANKSLFRGVSLLPPGSAWVFSANGVLTKKNYFTADSWENQPPLSPSEFSDQLGETFCRVLDRYTNGSRPVAMSLTGGLDSRMIMACAHANGRRLPCYTFNGSYRDCVDVRIARKVAAACSQPHQTISVGKEFLVQFPRLAEETVQITDGAMDVSGAAELYVNRLARRIAPVRLTGNYGSEILRRHVAFKPRALTAKMFSPEFNSYIVAAARTYSEQAQGNPLSFIAFKQVPWYHYARFAVEQSQITVRSPFLDNELVSLAFQAPAEARESPVFSLGVGVASSPGLSRIPTDRGFSYSAHRITNQLHQSVEEFLTKAEYAYDYGMPNWLARVDRALQPLRLERLFLGRQKFCHFRTWYKHELAGYVREILLDPRSRSRPYVNGKCLETSVNAHVSGHRNYTVEIHKLLSLELLHRALLD